MRGEAMPNAGAGRSWMAWGLTAILVAVTLFSLWAPRFLPLLDLPNHLAFISVWARLEDPSWGYDRFYEYNRMPVPYWGYYYAARLLSYLLSVEAANKVVLSLYALALPASLAVFARRFDRDPRVALLAFPLIFNFSFGLGFLSFCCGLPLILFSLVAVDRAVERPSVLRLVLVFVSALATYFMHPLPWVMLGLCALVLVALRAGTIRRGLLVTAVLASSAAVSGACAILSQRTLKDVGGTSAGFSARYEGARALLTNLPDRIAVTWPSQVDGVLLGLWGAVLVLLAGAYVLLRPVRGLRRGDWIPEACLGVAIVAYAACPTHTYKPVWWWMVGPRLVTTIALFWLTLVPARLGRRASALVFIGGLAGAIYIAALGARFLAFDSRARGIADVMSDVPRGSSTLFVQPQSDDDDAVDRWYDPYAQFHSYAQVLGGGFDPYMFHHGFPIRLRQGVTPLAAPHFFRQREFRFSTHARGYDFVVTRAELRDYAMFGDAQGRARLVKQSGAFRLYSTGAR